MEVKKFTQKHCWEIYEPIPDNVAFNGEEDFDYGDETEENWEPIPDYVASNGDEDFDSDDETEENSEEVLMAEEKTNHEGLRHSFASRALNACLTVMSVFVCFSLAIDLAQFLDKNLRTDPLCRPQEQFVHECSRFNLGEVENGTIGATVYYFNPIKGDPTLFAINAKKSNGDSIGDVPFEEFLRFPVKYDLQSEADELPITADIVKAKGAKCKHTLSFTCPELTQMITDFRKFHNSPISNLVRRFGSGQDMITKFTNLFYAILISMYCVNFVILVGILIVMICNIFRSQPIVDQPINNEEANDDE